MKQQVSDTLHERWRPGILLHHWHDNAKLIVANLYHRYRIDLIINGEKNKKEEIHSLSPFSFNWIKRS